MYSYNRIIVIRCGSVADYNKDKSVTFCILPPCNPTSSGGILRSADLQQRPRPYEEDVQSGRNGHGWVRWFGGAIGLWICVEV